MKAEVVTGYGGVDRFAEQEIDTPEPDEGQLRIRVEAIAINAMEVKLRTGELKDMMELEFPTVLGNEIAGVVDAVGEKVSDFAVGDRVVGLSVTGAYAEYALAKASQVTSIPAGLDVGHAVTIPTGAETSQRVMKALDVKSGETVVVNGAAGGVGSVAVQLLLRDGAQVIGTASEDNHDYLRKLGAVPTTYGDGVVERIHELAPDGVDAVFDVAGHGFVDAAVELRGGTDRIVTISQFDAGDRVTVSEGVAAEISSEDFASVVELAAKGEVACEIARTFTFGEIPAAHEMSEAGHLRGKIVVTGA
jgi:NADPH:quinone reductase-like Zn-dependent oxidoreductase